MYIINVLITYYYCRKIDDYTFYLLFEEGENYTLFGNANIYIINGTYQIVGFEINPSLKPLEYNIFKLPYRSSIVCTNIKVTIVILSIHIK